MFYRRQNGGFIIAGFGIRSSVFRAICSFFVSERPKEWFAREKGRIAPVALLLWVTWPNSSGRSFVMSDKRESITVALEKRDGSESRKSFFKKERMSEDQREGFALGHKQGKTVQKTVKTIQKLIVWSYFLWRFYTFLKLIWECVFNFHI